MIKFKVGDEVIAPKSFCWGTLKDKFIIGRIYPCDNQDNGCKDSGCPGYIDEEGGAKQRCFGQADDEGKVHYCLKKANKWRGGVK